MGGKTRPDVCYQCSGELPQRSPPCTGGKTADALSLSFNLLGPSM